MKYKCDMVRDLMPLCVDEAATDTSKNIVVEHLAECKKCEKYYINIINEIQLDTPNSEETKGYVTIAKKMRRRNLIIRLFIGFIVGIAFELLLFYAVGYRLTAESAADLSGRLNNSSKLIGNYDWGDWEFYFYNSENSYDVVTVKKHWNGWKAQDNYLIWPKFITDKGGIINAGSIYYWTDTDDKFGIQIFPLIVEDENVTSVEITAFNETKSLDVKAGEFNILVFENNDPNLGNNQLGYGYDAAGNIIYKLVKSEETMRYMWKRLIPKSMMIQ
ncbi:MAG: hypothetical protein K0S61_908 [Anaerocolumna sp.]|jgi:hypothetical protein|nr:hypothetical protein [Anaerocolumna sp.]